MRHLSRVLAFACHLAAFIVVLSLVPLVAVVCLVVDDDGCN